MLPAALRDKLLQVQEDISSSFRTLVLSESGRTVANACDSRFEDVRLDAGADLLNHYQFHWCRIREASDRNFKSARNADEIIHMIAQHVDQQHSYLTLLTQSLASVSQVTEQLRRIVHSFGDTEKLLQQTESQLIELEDIIEERELQRRMADQAAASAQLGQQRLQQIEQLKCQLESQHHQKIREHELKQTAVARERQAVFEEAFVSQIEEYKQTGSIPKSAIRITTNLDEVVVDEDPGALDQFLNDIE